MRLDIFCIFVCPSELGYPPWIMKGGGLETAYIVQIFGIKIHMHFLHNFFFNFSCTEH